MENFSNTYENFKLTVKATMPGTLSSFIYAYCKTLNVPEQSERAFIRKAVSFADLSRYVRTHITNDFDGWYRMNEDSPVLHEVCANIINAKDNRVNVYQPAKVAPTYFYLPSFPLAMVLVPVKR